MKKSILILLFLIPFKLFALEAIQPYQPTYIITGDTNEDQVKYQVSFKYGLLFPYESGIFLSYTQLSKWDIYDRSSPFRENNYSPGIFWEKQKPFKHLDFIRVSPEMHLSNGLDGQDSRSVDRCFIESQISYKFNFIKIGFREKIQHFYQFSLSSHNKDYKRYVGNFESEAFIQIISKRNYLSHEKLYVKGEWTNKFYWFESGLSFRIITSKIRPHIYIQYFRGYGEFLINYNKKTEALRIGFIFNPE
jgi:phospholipase A1